ncbi:helix-turn-helix domain-containing protein [Dictyobacter aurantiacus]|uniref:HTH cro/C1-type domain-containing protein n=1 Tax=Dictyobacter aurantiacus TaxID=1936993 RepID=A0A401ZGP7_9CHLR|nr:helix-turn-helix transcriptional regulator [Dictyobacter aurantiacus]GCE06016.1 hypothetical protein KDAU_33450 [Dictyobacter aurantiacus]
MKKTTQAVPNMLLRNARISLGLTQEEVADKIGASHPFLVNRWERGIASPSPRYLRQLVKFFEKKPEELGYCLKDSKAKKHI